MDRESCPACQDVAEMHALGWLDYYCKRHDTPPQKEG